MKKFWDFIFFEKISYLYMHGKSSFDTLEFEEIEYSYKKAEHQMRRQNNLEYVFSIVFIIIQILIFSC